MSSEQTKSVRAIRPPQFQVFICPRAGCGLRFTLEIDSPEKLRCPACRAELEAVGIPFERMAISSEQKGTSATQMDVLLDNIRSAWNVGSMLRTCDGAGVRRVYLCGVTSSPENPKVAKTALGAEKKQSWSVHLDGLAVAQMLKEQGMRLWALEGGPRSVSLFESRIGLSGDPIVLVCGNEVSGVDPGIMDLCEQVVCLPMQGIKGSLNVAVAFGIAVYFMRFAG